MFKIGEFSKIAQVAGSQLRYYDEIGLLKPAKLDERTGYRFYSARQLPTLNRILALKGLGLTLDQIQRMVQDDVPVEEIRGMLALSKAQLETKVQEDVMRLRLIESRLEQIEQAGAVDRYEVVVKSVPEQSYLSSRRILAGFAEAIPVIGAMERLLPSAVGQSRLGALTAILHSETYVDKDYDVEMGFVFDGEIAEPIAITDDLVLTTRVLPAVPRMVSAMHLGPPITTHDCRGALATWIESNNLTISGHGREVFHVPPRPGAEMETVLEIQYPVN